MTTRKPAEKKDEAEKIAGHIKKQAHVYSAKNAFGFRVKIDDVEIARIIRRVLNKARKEASKASHQAH